MIYNEDKIKRFGYGVIIGEHEHFHDETLRRIKKFLKEEIDPKKTLNSILKKLREDEKYLSKKRDSEEIDSLNESCSVNEYASSTPLTIMEIHDCVARQEMLIRAYKQLKHEEKK